MTSQAPRLEPPSVRVRESFLLAVQEFRAEGREYRERELAPWETESGFAGYVERLLGEAYAENLRAQHLVPQTTLWYVRDGREYLGRLSIRHRLTPLLVEEGGHIGYDVRPSARLQGHATAMLRAALPMAARLGIDPALITCDVDNAGSRKVIEANGGQLDDVRRGVLRFWTPTGRSTTAGAVAARNG